MSNKVEWTAKWPTEEGQYWFYGWYWKWEIKEKAPPHLSCVGVYTYAFKNDIRYVSNGLVMHKDEEGYGLWAKVEFPDLPDLERPTST